MRTSEGVDCLYRVPCSLHFMVVGIF